MNVLPTDRLDNERTDQMLEVVALGTVGAVATREMSDLDGVEVAGRAQDAELLRDGRGALAVDAEEALQADAVGAFLSRFRAGWTTVVEAGQFRGGRTRCEEGQGLTFLVDFEAPFRLDFTFLELLLLGCRSSLRPYAVSVVGATRRVFGRRWSQESQLGV